MTSRTPWTAMPTILNGSSNSHINGYAISAKSARGQHSTKRRHQSRNVNMAGPPSRELYVWWRKKVPWVRRQTRRASLDWTAEGGCPHIAPIYLRLFELFAERGAVL